MNQENKELVVGMLFGFGMIGLLQLSCLITVILFPDNIFALLLTMHLWSLYAMNYNRFFHRRNLKQLAFGFFLWEVLIYRVIVTLRDLYFHKGIFTKYDEVN